MYMEKDIFTMFVDVVTHLHSQCRIGSQQLTGELNSPQFYSLIIPY